MTLSRVGIVGALLDAVGGVIITLSNGVHSIYWADSSSDLGSPSLLLICGRIS